MHRSGTSLMAGLVRHLGVDLGERLVRADAWNRHGYHEDAELVAFHGRIFRALLPRGSHGHTDWGWSVTAVPDLSCLDRFRPAALRLAAARAARSPLWGFKDPRVSLLLDFWDGCIPDARFLLVYRAPWQVADSMQRLKADLFRRHPEYAIPIWCRYNRCLLDFHRRQSGRCLLVSIDALPGALRPLQSHVANRFGLRATGVDLSAGYDASLLARSQANDPWEGLLRIAYPTCAQLYAELQEAADLPADQGHPLGLPPLRQAPPAAAPVAPVLSVIVPTHDDAILLLDALASLERAALEDVEVIVVDDGSIGLESRRILTALAEAGYRILRTPNRGLAAARNTGIAAAAGRYILTLDADNRLLPGFVEAATAILEADSTVGIVHSGWRLFGQRTGTVDGTPFQIRRMAYGNAIDACAVFRRAVWKDLGGYYEAMSGLEDWEFWLHAHNRGWGFQLVSGPGFDYRVRPESLIQRSNRFGTRHRLRHLILQRHTALLADQMPAPLRSCAAACRRLMPARAAGRLERQLTWCWWHIAWELVHWRARIALVRKATAKG